MIAKIYSLMDFLMCWPLKTCSIAQHKVAWLSCLKCELCRLPGVCRSFFSESNSLLWTPTISILQLRKQMHVHKPIMTNINSIKFNNTSNHIHHIYLLVLFFS